MTKERWTELLRQKKISCQFCPLHRNENAKRNTRYAIKTWKRYRSKQYKNEKRKETILQ